MTAQVPAISIDGELVAIADATISVLDRGVLYGDGLFEVLRTWTGRAADLDAHLDRLARSAVALELALPPRADLVAAVERTIAAARAAAGAVDEHRIRIVVTRGAGPIGARLATLPPGRSIVIVEPLTAVPVMVSAAIVAWPLPPRAQPGHKTLAYLDHVIARELAARVGADEALRCDPHGDVVEGATSNLFAVIDGVVTTPPLVGALPGVTRAHVQACCATAGLEFRDDRLSVAAVRAAPELFLTSAVRGVVAITALDGAPRPHGPVTRRLADAYAMRMRALAARGSRVG